MLENGTSKWVQGKHRFSAQLGSYDDRKHRRDYRLANFGIVEFLDRPGYEIDGRKATCSRHANVNCRRGPVGHRNAKDGLSPRY